MVMVSTYLNFNYILVFFLISCSTSKNNPVIKNNLNQNKKTQKIISGPTNKNVNSIFKDKTSKYGLSGKKATHLYAVDFNNDNYTDIVLLKNYYSLIEFYKFDKNLKKFRKLSYNPFNRNTKASFMKFYDFNKDGIKDVLLGTFNSKGEYSTKSIRIFQGVLKNGNITYKEINNVLKIKDKLVTPSLVIFDYDLDGYLDIYVGTWFSYKDRKRIIVPDRLFKGGKNFSFKEVSHLLKGEFYFDKNTYTYINARPTFGVSSCDVDQNGYPDLMVSASSLYSNKLWFNLVSKTGGRVFKDYGKQTGYYQDDQGNYTLLGGGRSFYSLCADYNNDGIMDIVIGENYHNYDSEIIDRSSILKGVRREFPPKFIRNYYLRDISSKSWSNADRRGIWVDYNIDSLLDLLVDNSGFPPNSRLLVLEQQSNNSFVDKAKHYGVNILNPSGTVIIDINRDGLPDIITGQNSIRSSTMNTKIYVFENNLKRNEKKSLRIFLRGKRANKLGIGSMIIIETNKNIYRQWVEYSSGYLPSQNEEGILFGLNRGEKLKSLEVRWPILVKARGKLYPLFVKYNTNNINVYKHTDITVCENRKIKIGRYLNCN